MTTIGVLGAGQLGRMLALAGTPLGMRFCFFDPAAAPPASSLGHHVCAAWDDEAALDAFADGIDVVTYEVETVPPATVRRLQERVPVRPGPESLRVGGDRLVEKRFVSGLGLAVARFAPVDDRAALDDALRAVGVPALLKTRTGGFDGRGQARIDRPAHAEAAWNAIGGRPAILERRVPFRRELAIVAVRGADGTVRRYPLVETRHEDGILACAIAPAPGVDAMLEREADAIARRLLEALDHVGVLTIECFEVAGGLLVNEFAPRVHNAGHWTIEGAETSQFENHLRAIAGLPLGSTAPRAFSALVNVLGEMPPLAPLLAEPGAHLHLYGKSPRPRRKLGHVTVLADDPDRLAERVQRISRLAGCHPRPAIGSLT